MDPSPLPPSSKEFSLSPTSFPSNCHTQTLVNVRGQRCRDRVGFANAMLDAPVRERRGEVKEGQGGTEGVREGLKRG